MEEKDFRDHEIYEIFTRDDGKRFIHVLGFVWQNDGREHPSLVDEEGYPLPAPYSWTDYTNVVIPLEELLAPEDPKELVYHYEEMCNQYEGDYTWEEFVEEGGDGPHGDVLSYYDITADTPDGDYEHRF